MNEIQLTTEEIDLLLTIGLIMEFDQKSPNNIPNGGVNEIIVSNNIMEYEKFEEVEDSLYEYGLLDDEDFLTEKGKAYLEQLEKDLKGLQKDKGAKCGNDYTKIVFEEVKNFIEKTNDKIDWDMVCGICSIASLILTVF